MGFRYIDTDKTPQAKGVYSQGIESNGILYISGQLPINMMTSQLESDFSRAVLCSLNHIKNLLGEANMNLENIVKLNIFLLDMKDYSLFNEIYVEFFKGKRVPARSLVAVKELPKGAKVEIEAIASRDL